MTQPRVTAKIKDPKKNKNAKPSAIPIKISFMLIGSL